MENSDKTITKNWIEALKKEDNTEEFSEIVHEYYKLASMRVMQFMRDKYQVPKEDIPTLTIAVFCRFLNEVCYSVGANIKKDYGIYHMFDKKHLLNLLKVLNGESLDQFARDDIDTDIQIRLQSFREFVMKNASDFYI